jgi:DNA-binding transcriptional regulator YiaG
MSAANLTNVQEVARCEFLKLRTELELSQSEFAQCFSLTRAAVNNYERAMAPWPERFTSEYIALILERRIENKHRGFVIVLQLFRNGALGQ